jgi:leucine-rich repeat protein SHOC2
MERSDVERIIDESRAKGSTKLVLNDAGLDVLPASIGNLTSLRWLQLDRNQLTALPDSIGNLTELTWLSVNQNQLTNLPESISNLTNLRWLHLDQNQLSALPISITNLINLTTIHLTDNHLSNVSILQHLPNLSCVWLLNVYLPRRYWTNYSDWKSAWLLDESNATMRSILLGQLGYEKILNELSAVTIDTWREYTLLEIDGIEQIYVEVGISGHMETEPIALLKMTCPSTGHIHILRVPPGLVSAEVAITWVNHGIHPDKFTVQT